MIMPPGVVAVVPCAGEGRRMQPLSLHCPKPLLPILDAPMLLMTMEELAGPCERGTGSTASLESIEFIIKDQVMEDSIASIIEERGIRHTPLFFTRKPQGGDIIDSLATVIKSIDQPLVAIYMPDIYLHTQRTNTSKTLTKQLNETKSQAIIATGWSSSDVYSPHSFLSISREGRLQDIEPRSTFRSKYRSAGRYLLSKEVLEWAVLDIPKQERGERKVEDILSCLVHRGERVHTVNLGETDNINTPLDLLSANLDALTKKALPYFIGRSVVIDSSLNCSVVSSLSSVQNCSLTYSLVLPKSCISHVDLCRTIIYEEGILSFKKKVLKYET